MLDILKRAYRSSPPAIKYFYSSIPFRYRMGRTYRRLRRFLQQSERWSGDRLEDYQIQALRALLSHAYENVPYYRRTFCDAGFNPYSIKTRAALSKIPTITRHQVKYHLTDLTAKNIPRRSYHYSYTGGTTGEPLGFPMSNAAYFSEWAFIHDLWSRVGFRDGDRRLGFREFPMSKEVPCYFDPLYNELLVSTLRMDDDTLTSCVKQARRLRVSFIHGYPSAILVFSKFVERIPMQTPCFTAVLAGSEPTFAWQRQFFERVLGCRVFTWYGQSERVVLAGECECSVHYHAYPQYGVLELLDDDGRVIVEPNTVGEIVGTGFLNYAMPLIRYRTGDYAEYVGESCSCGREYSLIKSVVGRRTQNVLIGADRQIIPTTSLIMTNWALFRNIKEFQLEQNVEGVVVLKIVASEGFAEADEIQILREMKQNVGRALDFQIARVDKLHKTPRGKVPFLIQNLSLSKYTPVAMQEWSRG